MEISSNPPLLGLPPEVVERIISSLDLASLKNLRLSCKDLSNTCIGPYFKSFFNTQSTDLTKGSLDKLNAIASHTQLGPAVKHVIVRAIIYDPSELECLLATKRKRITTRNGPFMSTTEPACTEEELQEAKSDLEWLRARIKESSNQPDDSTTSMLESAFRSFAKLDFIELDASVIQAPGKSVSTQATREWYAIWARATQVFDITTLAIARSGIEVETLTFYRETHRCSIPSVEITDHIAALETAGFVEAGVHVKNVALSISTRVVCNFSKILEAREGLQGVEKIYQDAFGTSSAGLLKADDPEALAHDNFPGVAQLLQFMPNLEAIDLHLYNTLQGSTKSYDRIFNTVASEVHLPALEQCFLRGVPTTAESLLLFLEKHPKLNHFELREVRLTTGTWEAIFSHLSGMPALTKLRMSNLRSGGNGMLFNLQPPTKYDYKEFQQKRWSYPCMDGDMVHTLELGAEEIKRGLKFRARPQERQLGSPWFMMWMESTKGLYGPP
ncbi:uncharacterized protein BDZ99DRAFT_129374 [Mytilinidion resinicola]|uniref:F-box domain-containing protein n=1 Tax=Mytilinidion resinicola TaxID=574789 RepID=A0A6A6Z627_9PEZI|nr:uncharacterized protein BDZ99DRAFT_129374 [Mytilinidion resinicola]KAF2816123.1 hypothetical protein BDZ99DRAFT_129374 [Mytilinidion resinicola]